MAALALVIAGCADQQPMRDELAEVLPGVRCDDARFTVTSSNAWDGSRAVRIDGSPSCFRSVAAILSGFRKTLPGFARDGVVPDGSQYHMSFGLDPDHQAITWYREGK